MKKTDFKRGKEYWKEAWKHDRIGNRKELKQ